MPSDQQAAVDNVLDYHQRSKHHLQRYAAGPETLDWDHQPNPFRIFTGSRQYPFTLGADKLQSSYGQIYTPDAIPPLELNRENLGLFFELSFALSAWKQYGSARWSLRCNPSSGNLHPTEVYAVFMHSLDDLSAGVYHYRSDQHALEQRCEFTAIVPDSGPVTGFLLGLSNIAWREAWKYGERAFRYCQLDSGHAIACADYAAACLGWRIALATEYSDMQIASLLGLDRPDDFKQAELETPELLLRVSIDETMEWNDSDTLISCSLDGNWYGQANLLDPRPLYQWPAIDEVTQASTREHGDHIATRHSDDAKPAQAAATLQVNMPTLIRRRRSAQAYDGQTGMSASDFRRLLSSLTPQTHMPVWRAWPYTAQVQLVFFIHRVEGLSPGLYIQLRDTQRHDELRQQLNPQFDWQIPAQESAHAQYSQLGFYHLVSANAQAAARKFACHQDIASHSAFAVAMLAPLHDAVTQAPWQYRQLYWECGMIGQVMYLEAEASELRGTGIGCFFDDAIHQILGISDQSWQCMYQFTVGGALNDMRLISLPPYQDR